MSGGFVDLRLNTDSEGNDSFWPSFADIMTVVVMIFMLAMVVLLLRNLDLVQQLRATMEAERHAASQALRSSQQKDELSAMLTETESELAMLRFQNQQIKESNNDLEDRLAQREAELLRSHGEKSRLSTKSSQLKQRLDNLLEDRDRLRTRLAGRERDLQQAAERYLALEKNYQSLQQDRAQSERQIAQLQNQATQQQQRLDEVNSRALTVAQNLSREQERFAELEAKYDKLVRPARTSRGKFAVDVRYARRNGEPEILIKPSDTAEFRRVSTDEMHRLLAKLKEKYPQQLYIRVIFPEDSGLSYNEAWRFTSQLLNQYDYYYQGDSKGSDTRPASNNQPTETP